MLFFDAFSFAFPTFLQRIPFSLTEAVVWTVLSYFPVGLAGEPGRSALASCHATKKSDYMFMLLMLSLTCVQSSSCALHAPCFVFLSACLACKIALAPS